MLLTAPHRLRNRCRTVQDVHCILGPDRNRYLASVHSALRPDGRFLLFTGCANERTALSPEYDARTGLMQAPGGPGPRCFPTPDAVCEELSDVGFAVHRRNARDTGDDTDMLFVDSLRG